MPSDKNKQLHEEVEQVGVQPDLSIQNTENIPIKENIKSETSLPAKESVVEQVETLPQPMPEDEENFLEEAIGALSEKLKSGKKKPTKIPQAKDETVLQIEKIMEAGLSDAFAELSVVQRQEFKIKGEEVAWEIRNILRHTHVKVKKIFKLIFEWLKMLPGINKFFLEKEAKIKTDRIMAIKNQTNLYK